MANQLKMAIVQSILSLQAQGWSQRAIARRLGIHRETVARHVKRAAAASKPAKMHAGPGIGGEATAPPAECDFSKAANMHAGDPSPAEPACPAPAVAVNRPRYCDRWREAIEAKRAQGLTAQRIYQDLVAEHDFQRSYSTVQRYVRRLELRQPLPFRRMECAAGEEAQADFGVGAPLLIDGRRRRTHAAADQAFA